MSPSASGGRRPGLGWALVALLLGYAVVVHHGIGPVRDALHMAWYAPRGFLMDWAATDWLTYEVRHGLWGFGTPALLLGAAVWGTTRSAVARFLAVWAILSVGLCVYYGIEADGIWRFFHWRGSAVMLLLGAAGAAGMTSPWLAASWVRHAWPWRIVVYLPFAFLAVAMMRNATGTDQSLSFAISPWPVVPLFGLELVVPATAFAIAMAALLQASMARGGTRGLRVAVGAVGLVLAAVTLVAWFRSDLSFDWRIPALALCIATAVYVHTSGFEISGSQQVPAGQHAALGVLLVMAPVLVGLALVEHDYTYTRDVRARLITDALEDYAEREDAYPDTLDQLVEAGLLASVPVPRVGFRVLDEPQFVFQNFGMSYLLEFATPRWVQCAYNPPYLDEDEYEEADAEDDGEDVPGSWSCPSKPPELW